MNKPETLNQFTPQLIAWEVTRSCNFKCLHCRAGAQDKIYPNELATEQCYKLLDNIASFSKPIIILTGGEPMLREDIYDIARYGTRCGLRMVMAPCGMLVDDEAVGKMLDSGIQCISISLDGATAESHDGFRRVSGAFDCAMAAIETARRNNLSFQINTTITKHNLAELPDIMRLAEELGAVTFNPFLLVPTGRGKGLAGQAIAPQQYEEVLRWLDQQRSSAKIQLRVTCAPHYQRIIRQSFGGKDVAMGHGLGGCMGGKNFAFISHVGKVQICGFLEIQAGDLSKNDFDFKDIWENSSFLKEVRDIDSYKGKCGYCEYRRVCGGCRARAYAQTDDYLGSEPFCVYKP
jgi:AdoMet-dependent heme synthase